jgi:hypothetical protein
MTYRRMTREEAAQRTAERVAQAQARIEQAVAEIQSGADWRNYLALQARLHSYSALNAWLIHVQHHAAFTEGKVDTPWPSYVAGFKTWQALGRTVDEGQTGYQILAPNAHLLRRARSADGTIRPLSKGETVDRGEVEETRRAVHGWRIEHVFAAEQTSGKELPAPPAPVLLEGAAPAGLWDSIVAQITGRGYTIGLAGSAGELDGANGRTTFTARTVEVRADMDEAARVKTAIHELGHVILHRPETLRAAFTGRPLPSRDQLEVEAESVAFIVSDAHGLPTDGYTFPYVASWAGPDGAAAVRRAATRVAAAAKEIIAASTVEHSSGGRVPGADHAVSGAADEEYALRQREISEAVTDPVTIGIEVA